MIQEEEEEKKQTDRGYSMKTVAVFFNLLQPSSTSFNLPYWKLLTDVAQESHDWHRTRRAAPKINASLFRFQSQRAIWGPESDTTVI